MQSYLLFPIILKKFLNTESIFYTLCNLSKGIDIKTSGNSLLHGLVLHTRCLTYLLKFNLKMKDLILFSKLMLMSRRQDIVNFGPNFVKDKPNSHYALHYGANIIKYGVARNSAVWTMENYISSIIYLLIYNN